MRRDDGPEVALLGPVRSACQPGGEVEMRDDRDEDADGTRPRRGHGVAGTVAGSSIEMLVPPPCGLASVNRPPSASTRSLRPISPDPRAGSAPPPPLSAKVARTMSPSCRTMTEIAEAP